MRKTGSLCLIVMLFLSILSVFPIFYEIVKADPADVYVDDDADPGWYDATHVHTIQEGIDNVSSGGIVYIWDGIYYCENITVNKSLSLIGNGTANTHLEYTDIIAGLWHLMYLKADNINISALHFNNSLVTGGYQIINNNFETGNYTHIFNCLFTNSTEHAIKITPNPVINLHNINISNNEFYNAQGGIASTYCNNITIYNNIIGNVTGAISLYCFYGEISYNVITNTTGNGQIDLSGCDNISVHHNTLRHGLWTGICLETETNNCSVYDNTIIGFNESGCYGMELYSSYDNLIYNNYFVNDVNAYDDGQNIWNTSKILGTNIIGGPYLGGNYWSDYTGNDNTGDGLGDTELPYDSSGNIVTGGDYLPLLTLWDVYVDDDADPSWYDVTHVKTVQEGIDNVSSGGTVYVWDGTYNENVSVNKTISLIGEARNTTVIDGGGNDDVVNISADFVNISGFKINNSGSQNNPPDCGIQVEANYTHIYSCNLTGNARGIHIGKEETDFHHNNISDSDIFDNVFHGIYLQDSHNNTIYNNSISVSDKGIFIYAGGDNNCSFNYISECSEGIYMGGDNNLFCNNDVSYCSDDGVAVECSNSSIYSNNIHNNSEVGIYIQGNDNIMHTNYILNNTPEGFAVLDPSSDNLIYNNYFSQENNVMVEEGTGSIWNISKTLGTNIIGGPYLGGNYWNDYTGNDNDGDGLGNTNLPYTSSGEIVDGGDYLPLCAENTPPTFKITDWMEVAGKLGNEIRIWSLTVYNGSLYGGTSSNGKLYKWNDVDSWVEVAGKLGVVGDIYSLAVYNGSLYGGTGDNGKLYKWNDVDSWVEVAGNLTSETTIESLIVYNNNLYGGTGDNGRLYKWNDVDSWVEVAGKLGDEDFIYSLAVYNNNLYGGTGDNGRLYKWNDVDSWVEVAGEFAGEYTFYRLAVYNSSLFAGSHYSGKLYKWNDVDSWIEVAGQLGSEDIYSLAVYNGNLYGGTASTAKLYKWNDVDSWVEVADTLDVGGDIYSLAVYNGNLYGGTATNGGKLYKFSEYIYPYNNQQNVPIDTTLKILVIDMDNDSMSVSFYWDNDTLIETVTGVANNTYAETSSLSLNYDTSYSWYAVANDSLLENQSDTFSFTTEPNLPPNIFEVYPINNSIDASRRVQCYVNVTDPNNDTMGVSFYENTTGAWIRQYNETVIGTVVYWNYTDAKKYSTTYWWKVVVDDGVDSTTGICHFTTRGRQYQEEEEEVEEEPAPEVQLPPAGLSPEIISVIGILLACIVLATVFVWIYYKR